MKKTTIIFVLCVAMLSMFSCGKEVSNDTEVFCEDKELLKPENGIIEAGTFKVKISEDIEDKILYTSHDTGVDLYFCDDIRSFYDSDKGCTVYDMAKLCTISADTSVYRLISGPPSAWILGDEEEIQELNSHVQSVLGQVCVLKGSENTCPKEVIVEVDGRVYGSMMTDYYEEYEDMLKIEKRMYYILEIPTDEQLSQEENKSEYNSIKSSLIKNSKIVE